MHEQLYRRGKFADISTPAMSFSSLLSMARGKEPPKEPPKESERSNSKSDSKPNASRTEISRIPVVHPSTVPKVAHVASKAVSKASIAADAKLKVPSTTEIVQKPVKALQKVPPKIQPLKRESTKQDGSSIDKAVPPSRMPLVAKQPVPKNGSSVSSKSEGRKKLTFKEMLKKADTIDRSKLGITLKAKPVDKKPDLRYERRLRDESERTDEHLRTPSRSPTDSPLPSPIRRTRPNSRPIVERQNDKSKTAAPQISSRSARSSRPTPAPAAQPFPELLARQRQRSERPNQLKRRRDLSDDEDLEDFVVSEEDEVPHNEIWSLFNQRPRQNYESDSDSDMEARGADILLEERRSAAQARQEDIIEERRLAELAAKKRQRRR